MYTKEGLKHGIDRCKVNIASLKSAIAKEQRTIKDYRIMISEIEESDAKKRAAKEQPKRVEIVHDNQN